jgi:hypothetical protein
MIMLAPMFQMKDKVKLPLSLLLFNIKFPGRVHYTMYMKQKFDLMERLNL